MRRSKKLIVLCSVLAAVCIATFAVLRLEEHREKIRNSGETILAVPADSVTALSWEYGDTSLAFRKDEKWLYAEDEAFPVDPEKVQTLLELFEAFDAAFTIEAVEDFGQYGLDTPSCTIRLTTEDQTYEIALGDYSKMDAQRYVSIGDGKVYLVREDPLERYDTTLRDMIQDDTVPALDQVTGLRFSGAENYSVFYEADSQYTYAAEDVYFTQRNGATLPLDSERVERYLSGVSSMALSDYVSYNVTQEELERYGLDAPELVIEIDLSLENDDGARSNETFTLSISRDPAELEAAADSSEEADETVTAYARVGQSQIIYKISADKYQALKAAAYDDLRHREVFWAGFDAVTQIDVTLEGAAHTLTAETDDAERVWRYQEEEIQITDLQAALEALSADSFTGEKATEKEELRLTLHLDNETFPQTELVFYRYDGEHCLAAVDGQSVSLVSRAAVVDLIEAVNAIILTRPGN